MGAAAPGTVSLDALARIAGAENVREATPADAIDGVRPSFVAAPGSIEEAAELMRLASEYRLAVAPRGAGTKLGWGNPPSRLDLIVETRRLNRILDHAAGDLVVVTEAGVTLDALQDAVAPSGQMLALDPADGSATLGGIIAANASGPRRLRFGTMKDLLIGVTIVLPDGTIARSGGRVVKNVAGYDLGKLLTGSLGTLGLIVETIFRLHTRPQQRQIVTVDAAEPEALSDAVQAVLNSTLVPTVLDLQWQEGQGRLISVFEGIEPSVAAQADRALSMLSPFGDVHCADDAEAGAVWDELHRRPWRDGSTGVKISAVPAGLPSLLHAVDEMAGSFGIECRASGQAATSVLLAELSGDDESAALAIVELRRRVEVEGGSLVVLQATPALKRLVGVWGSAGDALAVMRRVKEQFDPLGIMNPGRFVGDI